MLSAAKRVAADNPWYTADQLANQTHGVYRYNMSLRYNYVRKLIGELGIVSQERSVVDLGCGDGQWSMQLNQGSSGRLIGIDYNDLRLTRYRKNVPWAEAKLGSCLDIPLESNSADIVMFHQVLEHISNPTIALREINRILKPAGWLILSVPNEGTWLKLRLQYRWIEPLALSTTDHVNFFTRSSLRTMLEANRFEVLRLDAVGFYFPHNGISRRLLNNKLSFFAGVGIAKALPVLRDCLFAWCQPTHRAD